VFICLAYVVDVTDLALDCCIHAITCLRWRTPAVETSGSRAARTRTACGLRSIRTAAAPGFRGTVQPLAWPRCVIAAQAKRSVTANLDNATYGQRASPQTLLAYNFALSRVACPHFLWPVSRGTTVRRRWGLPLTHVVCHWTTPAVIMDWRFPFRQNTASLSPSPALQHSQSFALPARRW